ncbi:hypothetical protein FOZ61_007461 [Perkinsus olseni]|uniref:Uncharacterized protein n=1 Tax=Perkinsus olseni TaxID=32597 RepID=A0A7J6L8W3_PEROL|nr:hypothetical protein FOZ61_007461 [Perkinsus olseni]
MYSDVVDDSPSTEDVPAATEISNRNRRWEPRDGSTVIPDKGFCFIYNLLRTFSESRTGGGRLYLVTRLWSDEDEYFGDIDERPPPRYFADLCSGTATTEGDIDMAVATEEEIGVEWLDDHSCNVRCGSEERAKRALEHPTTTKADEPWILSELIELTGKKPFRLSFRLATDKDVKQPGRTWRDSQFYRQSLNKKGYDSEGYKLAPRGIDLRPRGNRRRQRSRSRSPVGGRVEVDEEELVRRARRQERFGVVERRPVESAEREDRGESSSEEEWTKKDGRTMGILRDDDEDTAADDTSVQ